MKWSTPLIARNLASYACVVAAVAAVSFAVGGNILAFDFDFARSLIAVPYYEILAMTAAMVGAYLMRPRLWQLERVAGARSSWVALATALVGMALPLVITITGAVTRRDTEWDWTMSNAVVLGALVWILAPLLSAPLGGLCVAVIYFGLAILKQLFWDLHWFPVTMRDAGGALIEKRIVDESPHWWWACALLTVALAMNWWTRGQTAWAARVFDRDQ